MWQCGDNESGARYKGATRAVAVAAILALLTVAPAIAQTKAAAKPKADPVSKAEPRTRANPCAQHGAGFVQVEGTGSCVQVRGYLRM
jgi:hypothetical protein